MRRPRTRAVDARGQAMVEFVISANLVLLLIWSIFSLGLTFGRIVDLQSSTREAARTASLQYDKPEAVEEVEQSLAAALTLSDPEDVSISVSPEPGEGWDHGTDVTVSTEMEYSINVIGMDVWTGELGHEATARVE